MSLAPEKWCQQCGQSTQDMAAQTCIACGERFNLNFTPMVKTAAAQPASNPLGTKDGALEEIANLLNGAGVAVGNEQREYDITERIASLIAIKDYFVRQTDIARAALSQVPDGSNSPCAPAVIKADDDYCDICMRQHHPHCRLQPYGMSSYPGEHCLVKSHPDNEEQQWYKREEVDALLFAPAPSPWIATATREPTANDANAQGHILVSDEIMASVQQWQHAIRHRWALWTPIPPLPLPEKEKTKT